MREIGHALERITKTFRKQWLVNEHFQLRFLAFTALTALVACTVFYCGSLYFFSKYSALALQEGVRSSHPFFRVLANMQDMLTWIFAGISIAVLCFSTIAGLIFSNRVAGPLFRMRQHFEKVARGETVEGLSFREKDYFCDVADAYNKQMDYLRSSGKVSPSVKKSA